MNKKMKLRTAKLTVLFSALLLSLLPFFDVRADDNNRIFKAEVVELIDEKKIEAEGGKESWQQDLKLRGVEGEFAGKEVIFNGIGDVELLGHNRYQQGDKVLVVESLSSTGEAKYFVNDYVRNGSLAWLFALFALALLIVGRLKGLRAIISLTLSFLIIVYYIVPQILGGADAIIVTLIGSLAILVSVIYLTEGFGRASHIASLSILISLIFTMLLSWFFVSLAKLSGLGSEEVAYLATIQGFSVDFRGLLLSGIIVGTLGVLDDVIISQISAVQHLSAANPQFKKRELFKSAHSVGVSHISSMANTLFLAYAGASFPLLILFYSGQSAFSGFGDVVNNEQIATEIVRTLSGSIGLIFAVPISTWLAVLFLHKKE